MSTFPTAFRAFPPALGSGLTAAGARVTVLGTALTIFTAVPPPLLAAQTVEGRLFDGSTYEPAPAGVVSLVAEGGEVLGRVEVDSAGTFVLEVPGPGSYYLRGERIGYRTRTDGVLDVGAGGRVAVDFYIVPQPVELEGLEATGERVD